MRTILPARATTWTRVRRALVVGLTALTTMTASALAFGDGVDISHWQGTVSWTKVDSAGVQFAFMKATEGTSYRDPKLATNWTGAAAVGVYRGAYHFARPSVGSAGTQAQHYVSTVTRSRFDEPGSLPPVLDLEATGGLSATQLRSWVSRWLTTVEQLTGRTPIVYVSPSFWTDHLGNSTAFTRYPLWIAHYTSASQPRIPGGWPRWTFWQYTSSGTVSGIAGQVDKNRFNGSAADLAALARTTGGSDVPVPPGPTVPVVAATSLSVAAGAASVATNQAVTFSGALLAAGAAVPGRPVTLWAQSVGSTAWSQVGSATTDAAGAYTAQAVVPGSTDYQVRFAGDTAYAPATSGPSARVTVVQRTTPALDLKTTRTTVRRGRGVMLYGHLTSAGRGVAGQAVRIFKRPLAGGPWRLVSRTTSLAPTGWYSITLHPRRSRVYKAVAPGSLQYVAVRSNRAAVRMR